MKSFAVPIIYRSPLITEVKRRRKEADKLKKDFTPTILEFGPVQFYLARHFGFCYGVENAIEIAFRTVDENPGKRIFLLSEMIHNPQVNADLQSHGIEFMQDTYGKQLIPFEQLTAEDIVIIPAFGTTLAIEERLREIGIQIEKYNTTCPFVEKVWNRGEAIAQKDYSIIIHGKPEHEETRATFSHAEKNAPAIVIRDMQQAIQLAAYINGKKDPALFSHEFQGQYSINFNVAKDLQRIGVINQTTMLASDTQAIADYLKQVIIETYPGDSIAEHFADTRDTLCYATNDNQTAVTGMLAIDADIAIIVGGYNSSNTSHLVELCEQKLPSYFIKSADNILSDKEIRHYDLHTKLEKTTVDFLPPSVPARILITSGASCPDAIVESVIRKLTEYFIKEESFDAIVRRYIS